MNSLVVPIDDSMCISIFSILSETVTSVLDPSSPVSGLKVSYALYLFLNADGVTSSWTM